ncbi:hypothetical protein M9H77_20886 [Catharanthus roseus]|uniref:Uncharacterized protein n=1 Tax=Catharanthus roseus TaxID=4058 RepID=A0ACC0ANP5_CATRO|nr:hypothetical protein M9H77_20886 [Catharanthus roseus]
MVRPGARKGDDDLSPVTDRTGRVEGRTVTASSRDLRGRHRIYYDIGAPGSFTRPLHIPIGSRPFLQSLRPHTLPYDIYGSSHPPSHPPTALHDSLVHAPSVRPHIPYKSKFQELVEFSIPPDSSYSTHDYTTTDYGISSSEPFVGKDYGDIGIEGDRGVDSEPATVGSLHIDGEDDWRVHDHDDDNNDDDDYGDDAGDEEEHLPMAPVAHATPILSSCGRPRPRKGKRLTGSFISVMRGLHGMQRRLPTCTGTLVRPHVLMWRQCIPAHPIRPKEARMPVNNRMYVVRNTFVEELWLEAPSHLLIETWTSVLAVTPNECTDDYMQWYIPRNHPRIQNPVNVPDGFQVLVHAPMSLQTLMGMIVRQIDRDDI